jgi:hypothetical protein
VATPADPPSAAPPPPPSGPGQGNGALKVAPSVDVEVPRAAQAQRGAAERIEPSFTEPARDRADDLQRAKPTDRHPDTQTRRDEDRESVRSYVRARPVMTIAEEQGARAAWHRGDDAEIQRIRNAAAERVRRDTAAIAKATPAELGELAWILREPGTNETRERFRRALDEIASRMTESVRAVAKQAQPEEAGRIVGIPRERETEQAIPKSPAFWQGTPAQQEQRWLSQMTQDGSRFLHRGQLAFEDKGKSIVGYESSTPAVRAMLDLARAKDWQQFRVEGRPEFQRAVWLEAQARGIKIETASWKPSREDQELRLGRGFAEPAPATRTPAKGKAAAQREPEATSHGYKLVGSGTAPYQFHDGHRPSFYVRTEADDGKQRVTWGKDLERALARVDAIPGDRIELVRTGGVDVRVRGGAGDINAQRGEWTVKVLERGSREVPQTPPQAVIEKTLRSGGYPQRVIDEVLKGAKAEESRRTARGESFEVHAFDATAARTTPIPAVVAARSQPEQTRSR